ncbi:MAG: HRDC domain-containing protein, partial [Myxococcota bacterium]
CVVLYGASDARTQARLRGDAPHPGTLAGWKALQDLVFGATCRMETLARHFGDDAAAPCGRCDACLDRGRVTDGVSRARADGALVAKGKKYPTVWLPDKRVRPVRDPATRAARTPEVGLRAALRDLRKREARRRRWKPYQVFPNTALDAIVATRPDSVEALAAVPGIGPARIEKFSAVILELVRRF